MAHQSTAAQRSKVQQQQTSQVQLSTERSQVQQHIEVKYSSKEKSSTTAGGQQLGGGVCQPDFMLLHLCCLSNAPSSSSLATLSPIMHQCHHSLLSPYMYKLLHSYIICTLHNWDFVQGGNFPEDDTASIISSYCRSSIIINSSITS